MKIALKLKILKSLPIIIMITTDWMDHIQHRAEFIIFRQKCILLVLANTAMCRACPDGNAINEFPLMQLKFP